MSTKWLEGGAFNPPIVDGKSLVARYVHSGNKVIQPSSLDLATGIWTTQQSLNTLVGANNSVYSCIARCNTFINNIVPRELKEGDAMRIMVLSNNTFYIQSGTSSITSYPHINNNTIDVSKISFEIPLASSVTIDISSLNLKEFLFKGFGSRGRTGQSYIYVEGVHDGGVYSQANIILDGQNLSTHYQEQQVKYDQFTGIFTHQTIRSMKSVWTNTSGTWTTASAFEPNGRLFHIFSNFKFTGLKIQFDFCNDYTLEIYDLGGS